MRWFFTQIPSGVTRTEPFVTSTHFVVVKKPGCVSAISIRVLRADFGRLSGVSTVIVSSVAETKYWWPWRRPTYAASIRAPAGIVLTLDQFEICGVYRCGACAYAGTAGNSNDPTNAA